MKKLGLIFLLALLVLVAAFAVRVHLRRRSGPPSWPDMIESADMWRRPAVDVEPLLRALDRRDYASAHALLDESIREAWPLGDFEDDVGAVRDRLAERWAPASVGFMNNPAGGPVCSLAYSLDGEIGGKNVLEVIAMGAGREFTIVGWTLTSPLPTEDERAAPARETARLFLDAMQREDYEAARDLIEEPLRPDVRVAFLTWLRNRVWGKGAGEVEFTETLVGKLVNGERIYSVIAQPKGKEMNFLDIMMRQGEEGMRIASFDFKIKDE